MNGTDTSQGVLNLDWGKIDRETVVLSGNKHDIGVIARPTSTGFVAVELGVGADPIAMTDEAVAEQQALLGGADGWRWRKEYMRDFDAQSGMPVWEPAWLAVQRQRLQTPRLYREVADDGIALVTRPRGRLAVWTLPDDPPANLPDGVVSAERQFGIGIDVGAGVQNSNSTISVFTVDTHEQAAEFASNTVTPADLGRFAVAVAHWYNDALICCVGKMHGVETIRAMLDRCKYPHLWHHHIATRVTQTQTKDIGWMKGESSSELLTGPWTDALRYGTCTIRSELALKEHEQYLYDELGRIVWAPVASAPQEVRDRHGDRVIACMLAYRACLDMPEYVKSEYQPPPSMKSMEGRRLAWKREQDISKDGW